MSSWKIVKYLKEPLGAAPQHATWKYELILPEPLASWDVFDYWEKERIASMEENLKKGDVVFDIGAEHGWMSVVIAKLVGGENMCLFEPTPEFWPNIKQTWVKNKLKTPRLNFVGLVGAKSGHGMMAYNNSWPPEANGGLIDKLAYKYLHENPELPTIALDDVPIEPDAITIDVEGAELEVLKGAEELLAMKHPKLWASVHPDLGERDYGVKDGEVIKYLEGLGYTCEYLATDHEVHYFCHV